MTTQRKFEIGAAILMVIVLIVVGVQWIQEREARVKAEATQSADDKILAASQDAIKSRDENTAKVTAALAAQAAAIQTPQQAAQVVLHYLPAPPAAPGQVAAPQAPIPVVDKSQLSEAVQAQLPDSPTYSILTGAQMTAQAKDDLACDAATKSLTTCQADETDLHAELTAETKTAQTWESTAKGGTMLQRLGKIAKFMACAGAGAYVGSKVDKNSGTTGAAIGAGAAVAGCSLF